MQHCYICWVVHPVLNNATSGAIGTKTRCPSIPRAESITLSSVHGSRLEIKSACGGARRCMPNLLTSAKHINNLFTSPHSRHTCSHPARLQHMFNHRATFATSAQSPGWAAHVQPLHLYFVHVQYSAHLTLPWAQCEFPPTFDSYLCSPSLWGHEK
jgi:hypothetical protein